MRKVDSIIAVVFTCTAVIFNFLYMGLPIIILNAGLIISLLIWVSYPSPYNKKVNGLFIAGIFLQFIHFLEEYFTEFYKELPPIFNRLPWRNEQFIIFNSIWLVILIAAAFGIAFQIKASYVVVWFFVLIIGIGNGVMHTLLTLLQGRYFPGTISSLVLFIVGILMLYTIRMQKGNAYEIQS